jgi:hypothetical protein
MRRSLLYVSVKQPSLPSKSPRLESLSGPTARRPNMLFVMICEITPDHPVLEATTRREMDWKLNSDREDSTEKLFSGGLKI